MDKFFTRYDPLQSSGMHAEDTFRGLWIVICRLVVCDDKLFIDKDILEDADLTAWHFTPHGTLFIENCGDQGIVYSYDVVEGMLQITPEGGGDFGYSGTYDYYIRNGEATLSRKSATPNCLWSGKRESTEEERIILVRYQGKDCDYGEMKKLRYKEAIAKGATPIDIEWEEQRIYEEEKRFMESLCYEKGNSIDVLDDEFDDKD